jgi:hypothetical protein
MKVSNSYIIMELVILEKIPKRPTINDIIKLNQFDNPVLYLCFTNDLSFDSYSYVRRVFSI